MILGFYDEDDDYPGKPIRRSMQFSIQLEDSVVDDAQLVALRNATAAISSAALETENLIIQDTDGSAAAVDTPYSVRDKVVLRFKTAVGTDVRCTVPAPLPGVLINDDEVDGDDDAIQDLISSVMLCCCDQSGNAVTTYTGGSRIRN